MYSCFLKGEVNAVLGIVDLSKGIWWYPACRSNDDKYFAPFNWKKNILYLWHWPNKLPCDLIECTVGNNKMFSSITLEDNYDGMTEIHIPSIIM